MEIEPSRPHFPVRRRLVSEPTTVETNWTFRQPRASTHFHRGSSSRRPKWVVLAWSGFASLIDLLISFSLTCLFTFIIAMVTQVSLAEVSTFLRDHFRFEFALGVFVIYSIYLVTFRVFAGCSLGEWACGIRLGEPRHRISDDYSLKVIQRALLVFGTGLVTLPLLSWLSGEDQAGRLVGLPLVMQTLR